MPEFQNQEHPEIVAEEVGLVFTLEFRETLQETRFEVSPLQGLLAEQSLAGKLA